MEVLVPPKAGEDHAWARETQTHLRENFPTYFDWEDMSLTRRMLYGYED